MADIQTDLSRLAATDTSPQIMGSGIGMQLPTGIPNTPPLVVNQQNESPDIYQQYAANPVSQPVQQNGEPLDIYQQYAPDNKSAKPNIPDQTVMRELGLATRAGLEGVAGLGDLFIAAPYNATQEGLSALTGKKPPFGLMMPPSQLVGQGLTALGVPSPQTDEENIVAQGVKGMVAAPIIGPENAISSMISGGAAGMAGEGTRQAGGGPLTQLAASAAAGIAAPTVINTAGKLSAGAINALSEIKRGMTDSGIDQMVGQTLIKNASNPDAAIASLDAHPQFVPDSPAAAGVASNDPGLISLQKTRMNMGGKGWSDVIEQQNAARSSALNDMAGTPIDIQKSIANRSLLTKPLYEAAKNDPINPDTFQPVLNNIDKAISDVGENSDAGKNLLGLKKDILSTMPNSGKPAITPQPIMDYFGTLVAPSQSPTAAIAPQRVAQGPLVQIYKEARDAAEKTGLQEGAYSSSVRGIVKPIIGQLGDALESQSNNLSIANAKFRELSQPINQMQELQDFKNSVETTQTDINGNKSLGPALVDKYLRKNGEDMQKVLTPEQWKMIGGLHQDLQRSNLVNNPAYKASGAETASNLTKNDEIIKNALQDVITKGPLKFIMPDVTGKFQSKLDSALQDPEQASALMKLAKSKPISPITTTPYLDQLRAQIIGTAAGSTSAINQTQQQGVK